MIQQDNDTIVAIATPAGRAGVGIIRISGPKAYAIAQSLSQKTKLPARQAVYTAIYDLKNELIDKGIVIYFQAPHSFTGEEVIEIHAHGAPVLLDYLLCVCVLLGARVARPGEFSERAFLNDKIDLVQAEAIADLIAAHSLTAARMAIRSLAGDFSRAITKISQEMVQLRLFVEAAIDFPEEEIDFFSDGKVVSLLQALLEKLAAIRAEAAAGVLMQEGLSLVIVGKPNAGKSTLINRLAGREVAIVTEIAGTTRDLIREYILLDGLPIHISDTAGLRDSEDIVEKEGIRRAWQEVSQADCILSIRDIQDSVDTSLNQAIAAKVSSGVPIINIINKIDSCAVVAKQADEEVYLSAKTGEGIDLLIQAIKSAVGLTANEGQFLARRRHLTAIDEAKQYLLSSVALHESRSFELLAEDLRAAHMALCAITGEFSSDDLLGEIFANFCIGK